MGNKSKSKHPPVSVREAEAILERARRREAAQAAGRGAGEYQYQEHFTRPRIDLATLDTPDVSHADQWAAFLNRPGRFYVARLDIPADDKAHGLKVTAQTTLKADDQQLPYLVEVLRQVRGAFGEHCRITLNPADVASVETSRAAGPSSRVGADGIQPTTEEHHRRHAEAVARYKAETAATANRYAEVVEAERRLAEQRAAAVERPATAEELAMVREMRARAEARNGYTLPPTNGHVDTIPDGPPFEYGRDWVGPDQEFTKEELAEMLPGQTRAEVAAELGKTPEEIGGSVHHADVMPEELAAELGVPVESLTRIPMVGGGYAWTVTPPAAPEPGRHAAPDEAAP